MNNGTLCDTLWYFVMSIVKYRESHYVKVLNIYDRIDVHKLFQTKVLYCKSHNPSSSWLHMFFINVAAITNLSQG